jgi:hypothetical protein
VVALLSPSSVTVLSIEIFRLPTPAERFTPGANGGPESRLVVSAGTESNCS